MLNCYTSEVCAVQPDGKSSKDFEDDEQVIDIENCQVPTHRRNKIFLNNITQTINCHK